MLIFPVRHHSPAASLQVARLIRERRPKAVLVEGPCDATRLIPLLLDPATEPPVAIYGYLPGGEGRAVYYPFCAYSPEYVALKAGQEVGARLLFCDVSVGHSFATRDEQTTESQYGEFASALAEAAGFDSFDELWETAFEQEAGPQYIEVLTNFGGKARELSGRDARDDVRERHMAWTAQSLASDGIRPEEIMLVCGAAHAQRIASILEAGAAAEAPKPEQDAEVTLIPYSYPRLSEQSGYGAGNRAPWFYQLVWEMQGDYATAARVSLSALAGRLRQQGLSASLAQTIDAYNLATVLAAMRDKPAPGVLEVAEAATACFGQGQPVAVDLPLRAVLIGDAVGKVTPKIGRTPLQVEFYETAGRLSVPILDSPRPVLLHMVEAKEAETSVFFHRLRVAAIPFAAQVESGLGGRGRAVTQDPLEHLRRVREKWETQWSPATDARLVEQTARGSTLAEAVGRITGERLQQAARIDEGTEALLQIALCDLPDLFPQGMERCEELSADSSSFPALARSTYHLDGLLNYGAARRLPVAELGALAARLFTRAVLNLPSAAVCGDEAAQEVATTLTPLYELVGRGSPAAADLDGFWFGVGSVAEMEGAHPLIRGLSLVLLELGGKLEPGELATRLRFWLSRAADATANAHLVAGLFTLHRGTLVRNKPLISAVTDFLLELEIDQLGPLLPVLRRSLGNLSAAERSYLGETLGALLGLGYGEAGMALKVSDTDLELLREADAAVAAILAQWRDRYGIG